MSGFLVAPIFHVEQIDRAELNRLIHLWGHRMGVYARPHHTVEAHHALLFHGRPVAVTATGDTPNIVVGDTRLLRSEVVELCRLCAVEGIFADPMLQLWRTGIFPALAARRPNPASVVAISYQEDGSKQDSLFLADGWSRIGRGRGGAQDSRHGREGYKLAIWGWPHAALEIATARRKARAA
ncbi:MAG: hypothetical protein JWO51_169 [Rhodospirillales bacterium]|nr:hypothetical protein [Rhodospirillales bacterium]